MPFLMNNGLMINYKIHGNTKNNCIVLVPGLNGQLIDWPKEMITTFKKAGFCILAFDNRDAGRSMGSHHTRVNTSHLLVRMKKGKKISLPYGLNDMASDIFLLIKKLSLKKVHLVGLSMGGHIAQVFALQYSEYLLSLTLIATSSGDADLPSPAPEIDKYFSTFLQQHERQNFHVSIQHYLELYKIYFPHDFNEEYARDLLKRKIKRTLKIADMKRQILALVFASPRGKRLGGLKVNTLIIHGDSDPVFPPEHGKYLAKCIPNSSLYLVQKMGHGISNNNGTQIYKAMIKHFKSTDSNFS